MTTVHMVVGIAVLAANALTGVWGGVAWIRARVSHAFWWMLRTAQAAVVVQAALGFVLVAQGHSSPDDLHVLYGVSPLVVTLVSEGMRAGAAERELEGVEDVEALTRAEQIAIARKVSMSEMVVMTVGALLILTLALRAYQTGG
jgi:hypothetical protein